MADENQSPEPVLKALAPSEHEWLKLFQQMQTQQTDSQERQTDRLVEAFGSQMEANRGAIDGLRTDTTSGLTEVRGAMNRNSIAVVVVALVGFAALVAMATGSTLDFAVGPEGLVVGAEAAEP